MGSTHFLKSDIQMTSIKKLHNTDHYRNASQNYNEIPKVSYSIIEQILNYVQKYLKCEDKYL